MKKWLWLLFLFVFNFVIGQEDSVITVPEIELTKIKVDTVKAKLEIEPISSTSRIVNMIESNTLNIDISDAVKELPGVTINEYGGPGKLKIIQLRGISAGLSTILFDGIKTPSSYTGQVDLSKFSTKGITLLKINHFTPQDISLPASSYNGNGFIEINTNGIDTNKNIATGIRTGSNQLINPFVTIQHKKLSFSFDHIYSQGEYIFNDINGVERKRENNEVSSTNLTCSYLLKSNKNSSLKFNQTLNHTDQNLPGAVIINSLQKSSQSLKNTFSNSSIVYKHKINKATISTYFSNFINQSHYKDPLFLNSTGGILNIFNERTNLFGINVSRKHTNVSYFLSSDIERNKLTSNQEIEALRNISNTIIGLNFKKGKINLKTRTNYLNTNSQKQNDDLYPSISLSYKLFDKHNLYVHSYYKRYYRLPSFSEIYFQKIVNNDLIKEDAKQLSLGTYNLIKINKLKMSIYSSFDVFNIIHDNKIVAIPTQNSFVWSFLNIGKVNSQGIEIFSSIKKELNNLKIKLTGSYTKQKTIDISDHTSANFNNQVPYIPIDVFNSSISIRFKSYELFYNYRFNGFRYFHLENIASNVIPSYSLQNISLSKEWKIKNNLLTSSLAIKNLGNINYEVVRSFPMPPRQLFVQITYKI